MTPLVDRPQAEFTATLACTGIPCGAENRVLNISGETLILDVTTPSTRNSIV